VRFAPRSIPAGDAAAYVEQSISAAPNRYEARVTLRAPAEQISSRLPPQSGVLEPIDEHSCEYRTGEDSLSWLALRIAMLGVDFEVHEPPELADHLRLLAARLRRAAG
jgi:predicted DNA-binding transcriptional regulator YafY